MMRFRISGVFCAAVCLLALLCVGSPAQAQTLTVLRSFQDGLWNDGWGEHGGFPEHRPESGLVRSPAGNLYGTTSSGGDMDQGTVFELKRNADGTFTYGVIYSFQNCSYGTHCDGAAPRARLIMDGQGSLYGTTEGGGAHHWGVVFRLSPPTMPAGSWTQTVLYHFRGEEDGAYPEGRLAIDASGHLYGTTAEGGRYGDGTVFMVAIATGSFVVLHDFSGTTYGTYPLGLTIDASGNLFGTTAWGGDLGCGNDWGCGTLYELSPSSAGTYNYRVLHQFTSAVDFGLGPSSPPLMDSSGNLYGTTGSSDWRVPNTIYKLAVDTSAATGYSMQVLYSFPALATAEQPGGDLLIDSAGNLYGTTSGDKQTRYGTVYELRYGASSIDTLHTFTGTMHGDGNYPTGGLVMDAAGNLYGTTEMGGDYDDGAVFQLGPASRSAVVSLSPSSVPFGDVLVNHTSTQSVVTVTNTGNADLSFGVNAVTLAGPSGEFALVSDTCSAHTIAPNDTCFVGVTFTPATTGIRDATLTFNDNASNAPQSATLVGTGVAPAVSLSATALAFGSQNVGTTSAGQSLTLTNSGTAPLSVGSITGSANFVLTANPCPSTLAAGSSCTITVAFAPTTAGLVYGLLTVPDDAVGTNHTVSLTGTGVTTNFVTPQELIAALIGQVTRLRHDGALNFGQYNSLVKQLQNVIDMIEARKIRGAISILTNFIAQVTALQNGGVLTPAQAGALVDAARAVIAQLS